MRFDTSAKFSLSLFLCICAFAFPWPVSISLAFIVLGMMIVAQPFRPRSAKAWKSFRRFLIYMLTLGIVLIVLNGLLIREGRITAAAGSIHLYEEGLLFGVTIVARLMLLSLSILMFFLSTTIQSFAQFLNEARLPTTITNILLLSFFYIENLPARVQQIYWAQEARGAPVRASLPARVKAFFSMLSPLVLSSVAESVDRGLALDLRGFHRSSQPTRRFETSLLGYLFFSLSIVLSLWKIIRWLLD